MPYLRGKRDPMNNSSGVFSLKALTAGIIAGACLTIAYAYPSCASAGSNLPALIVIDNDQLEAQENSIQYEPLATDAAATRVKVGARFPIVISSEVSSKTARAGDPVDRCAPRSWRGEDVGHP